MPWCPECKTEYRSGFSKCADCGSGLTAELPVEAEAAYDPNVRLKHLVSYISKQRAYFIQSVLESGGIQAMVTTDDCASFRPDLAYLTGGSRIYVREADFETASEMLKTVPEEPRADSEKLNQSKRDKLMAMLWKFTAWLLVIPVIGGIIILAVLGILIGLTS